MTDTKPQTEERRSFLSRLFGSGTQPERLPVPPIEEQKDDTPATFNLVPSKDVFRVGEYYETFFMASKFGFRIKLISTPLELTFNDVVEMEPGFIYDVSCHFAKITSRRLIREDLPEMEVVVEVLYPDGHSSEETLTIRIDENSIIRPNAIWMPRQISINIDEEKFIPVTYNPTDYVCPGLECKTHGEHVCKVNIYRDLISVKGIRPGTTTLKVNPEGFRDLACITKVNVRENVTLIISADYDAHGNPIDFTVSAESQHDFPYRLAVILSYVQGRNHDVILVNSGDGEKDFVTNSTMSIPNLAKTLRKLHGTHIHALQLDFTLLQIDRRFYNMTVVREFENGMQWWKDIPTEKPYRKQ